MGSTVEILVKRSQLYLLARNGEVKNEMSSYIAMLYDNWIT